MTMNADVIFMFVLYGFVAGCFGLAGLLWYAASEYAKLQRRFNTVLVEPEPLTKLAKFGELLDDKLGGGK